MMAAIQSGAVGFLSKETLTPGDPRRSHPKRRRAGRGFWPPSSSAG